MKLSRVRRIAFAATVTVAGACVDDFPAEPELAVAIADTIIGSTTLAVTDTAMLEGVFLSRAGARLTDLQIDWQSSDSAIATVVRLVPASGQRDSLRARVTARRSGTASVVATVVHPGFERTQSILRISIQAWGVGQDGSWPDLMTVTETSMVQVAIPNADTTVANDLRIQWQSSDEALLRVTRTIPPVDPTAAEVLAAKRTATLIAHGSGRPEILVTVERPGFETSEFRRSIQVDTLRIEPDSVWPDTLMVGDSALLTVVVKNGRGIELLGRDIDWQSADTGILTVEERSPTNALIRAQGRGSAHVLATVQPDGFVKSGFLDSTRVMERWTLVSAGLDHTCAVAFSRDAYCWGNGSKGALGNGRPVNSSVPTGVFAIGNLKFRSVSAGDENTCAIIIGDVAYCWGSGTLGRLGTGSQSDQFIPVPVSAGRTFRFVSAGQTTCGVSGLSESFCWGSNSDLQLGTPLLGPEKCGALDCSLTPIGVTSGLGDTLYSLSIDVATFHTCAISNDPSTNHWAFCWGSGTVDPSTLDTIYLLGDSTFLSRVPTRVAPPSGSIQPLSVDSLSAGDKHTCAVTTSGAVYCWGRNSRGQLGIDSRVNRAKPTAAITGAGKTFVSISAGDSHTCALTTNGEAYCWGANDYGQLGADSMSTADILIPALVLGGHRFRSLSAGDFHTCAITTSGATYCWGRNTAGQLGTTLATRTCAVGGLVTDCTLVPRRVSEPF